MDGQHLACDLTGDEHGLLILPDAGTLPLAHRVTLGAPHCDPTVNLYDTYHVPGYILRASPHYSNVESDVDRLIDFRASTLLRARLVPDVAVPAKLRSPFGGVATVGADGLQT